MNEYGINLASLENTMTLHQDQKDEMSNLVPDSTKSKHHMKGRQSPSSLARVRSDTWSSIQSLLTANKVEDLTIQCKHSVVNSGVGQLTTIPKGDIKVMSLWTNEMVPARFRPIRRQHALT